MWEQQRVGLSIEFVAQCLCEIGGPADKVGGAEGGTELAGDVERAAQLVEGGLAHPGGWVGKRQVWGCVGNHAQVVVDEGCAHGGPVGALRRGCRGLEGQIEKIEPQPCSPRDFREERGAWVVHHAKDHRVSLPKRIQKNMLPASVSCPAVARNSPQPGSCGWW